MQIYRYPKVGETAMLCSLRETERSRNENSIYFSTVYLQQMLRL